MLAEENKNAGPSALDGKSTENLVFPHFTVHLYAFVTLLFILYLSRGVSLMLAWKHNENVINVNLIKTLLYLILQLCIAL